MDPRARRVDEGELGSDGLVSLGECCRCPGRCHLGGKGAHRRSRKRRGVDDSIEMMCINGLDERLRICEIDRLSGRHFDSAKLGSLGSGAGRFPHCITARAEQGLGDGCAKVARAAENEDVGHASSVLSGIAVVFRRGVSGVDAALTSSYVVIYPGEGKRHSFFDVPPWTLVFLSAELGPPRPSFIPWRMTHGPTVIRVHS